MQTDRLPAPARWVLKKRRELRCRRIVAEVETWAGMSILDVGCGKTGRSFSDYAHPSWHITGVDLIETDLVHHAHPRFTYRRADASELPFDDMSFDLAVCIGVLEHLTDEAAFARACAELQRVAEQYLVVVPYKWAWIEPHYGVPFFGGMPPAMRAVITQLFGLSQHERTVWRTNAEYLLAFPGASLHLTPSMEMIAIVRTSYAPARAASRSRDRARHPIRSGSAR